MQREPHFATCVYAIFDAVSGYCEVASAGHLPPLLVRRTARNEFLDVSPAPPLGVGTGPIQSRVLKIEDGSLLVLYTDGLVENAHQATSTRDSRGCARSSDPARPTVRWKICARPRWPASTPTTSATTSRC